jgi:tRNA (cmo5U34)-methyltransferase
MKAVSVGQNIAAENAAWNFGGNVPDHFVDHIKHSVPLYEEGHHVIEQTSDWFVGANSVVYEIGVSTGELLRKVARRHAKRAGARFIGMDVETAMVAKAREHTADTPSITILEDDARLFSFEPADLILSYYTMQFIPPRDRQALFDKLYESLNWGGALIVFEKVRAPDARFQDIAVGLYNEFKISQGFDAEEIVSKTRSLKGVLEPFSTQGNLDLFRRAGFVDVMPIMKYVCFEGFLAIK